MSLNTELAAFRAHFMGKVPPEIRAAMDRADLDLAASGITDRALKAGDFAPDFALPDVSDAPVDLQSLLATGPVVLSFYRGGWCPYCNLELRALQQMLPAFIARGASLVAVLAGPSGRRPGGCARIYPLGGRMRPRHAAR
jgi:thiol-disulfide isomerase/thioredoxin